MNCPTTNRAGRWLLAAVATGVLGCSSESEQLTIDDAVNAGLEKDQQQLFQAIGAKDGWSGTWAGDRVELYQFSNEAAIPSDMFQMAVGPTTVYGWVERCQVRNLLMISKGNKACQELKTLDGPAEPALRSEPEKHI